MSIVGEYCESIVGIVSIVRGYCEQLLAAAGRACWSNIHRRSGGGRSLIFVLTVVHWDVSEYWIQKVTLMINMKIALIIKWLVMGA